MIGSGFVHFLSNASSNAVCQRFNLGTSNVSMTSLNGYKYKDRQLTNSSNVITLPFSLLSLLEKYPLLITELPPTPAIISLNQAEENTVIAIYGGDFGDDTPTRRLYFGLGWNTANDPANARSYSYRGDTFTWYGLESGRIYYASSFISNTVTDQKSLVVFSTGQVFWG
jgi:hypothetical protein